MEKSLYRGKIRIETVHTIRHASGNGKRAGEYQKLLCEPYIDAPQEGATADACTLFELFEAKLEAMRGNLVQAAVDLAKG